MKKLCFYINSDWYFNLHWKERALAAKENGYEVHVVCNFENAKIFNDFESSGIQPHNSRMSEQSLNPLVIFRDLVRSLQIIRKINPDILHCITIKPCLIGGFYAKAFRKKLVLSFVGLGRVFSSNAKKYRILKYIVSIFYRWISKKKDIFFIFEHDLDRDKIISITGIDSSKTIVIDGAGIDTGKFEYLNEPDNTPPTVLFASRLIWSKGLSDLVEARKVLLKKGIHFNLVVAGITVKKDPDAIPDNVIRKWSEAEDIIWLGQRDDVKTLIEESNIVALPSVYAEGVPRILIEAAAVGRPSIAYDRGGCSSIVVNNNTGFIVDKNIDDLAQKLETLITNKKLRAEFGINARAWVMSRFCSTYVIKKTLGVYNELE
ncbi:glycosyltransferase family 4 protein [Pantoea vagans]|uniref:glycosyltransferase family 4 protein n=1 Tax=Pantoea vagans TaxID=470934 RepID=UPI0028E7AA51|nr:glycosyltransferase family 4 protein [Pantoea vagans]